MALMPGARSPLEGLEIKAGVAAPHEEIAGTAVWGVATEPRGLKTVPKVSSSAPVDARPTPSHSFQLHSGEASRTSVPPGPLTSRTRPSKDTTRCRHP